MQPSSSAGQKTKDTDQRLHARFKRLVKVHYGLADGPLVPVGGWVSDCSLGGIRLIVREELALGTHLLVRPTTAPATTPWLKVEVKHSIPGEGDETWEIGCQFDRAPSYSTILLFR